MTPPEYEPGFESNARPKKKWNRPWRAHNGVHIPDPVGVTAMNLDPNQGEDIDA